MRSLLSPSRGNVALALASVALFTSLGGVGWAAGLIDGHDLKNRSVLGKRLAPGAVSHSRLFRDAVASDKVKDGSLTRDDVAGDFFDGLQPLLAKGSVTEALLGDKAVTAAKIADDAVGSAAIARNAVTGSELDASGAATLDYGAIATGACATATATLTGADILGDALVVTPPVGFAGSTATAVPITATSFAVTVCNLTGGGAIEPDGLYRWVAVQA